MEKLTKEEMDENFKSNMLINLSQAILIDKSYVPKLKEFIQKNAEWFEKVMGPGITVVRDSE